MTYKFTPPTVLGIRRSTMILSTIILHISSFLLSGNQLFGQTQVALPLLSYSNDGSQTLTPTIKMNIIPGPDPVVSINVDGGAQPSWLSFKESMGSDGKYNIDLFVTPGQCVPRPTGKAVCATECSTVIGFSGAELSRCYTLDVTAFTQTRTHYLCVYGDSLLVVTSPGDPDFDVTLAASEVKYWSTNREEQLRWSLNPNDDPGDPNDSVNPAYLTIVDPTATENPVQLNYAPNTTETGSYTLKVSNENPNSTNFEACDPSASVVVNVKASEETTAVGTVDLIILVDVSGSMGERGACTPEQGGTQYNPADFASKMGFVKTNLKAIYSKIVEIGPPAGSRIGIVTFSDKAEKKLIGGNFFNLFSSAATTPGIMSIIDGLQPDAWTNMGEGLEVCIRDLMNNSNAAKKQIILITNGMQNGNKPVRRSSGTVYIDLNNDSNIDGGEAIPDEVTIFSIAIFQPSGEYINLLKDIAKNNARFTDVCALNEAVDQAFAGTYSNFSPKSAGYRRGNFAGTTATINYSLAEKEFDKIIVSLSSTQNTNLNFSFQKNVGGSWVDITSGGNIQQVHNNYSIFSIAGLPKVVNGVNITPQGDYRIVATSTKPGADYFASVIVDDRGLKEKTFIQSKIFRAGNSISLSTRLRYDGNPVHQANATVRAVIHRPVLSFEKQMADENIPGDKVESAPYDLEKRGSSIFKKLGLKPADGNTFEDGLPLIEQKFQVVVYEKNFLGKIVYTTDTIPLPEITNGIYRANYNNTRVTGLYGVEYLINGNLPAPGNFFRTASHSTPVLFGKPERSESDFYLFDENGNLFLSLRPVDVYDNYLGMGKAEEIKITMSSGSSRPILDYLDGHYVIPLNVPVNDNPFVVITISGMEFYRGLLLNIPQKRFFFAIQGGWANPLAKFDSVADPGIFAGLKLGYRINRRLGVLAEAGYFSFKDATEININPNIFGGGAGLFLIAASLPNAGGITVQLESTIGYYKPRNQDGTWGLRGGIELAKYFSTWFSASLGTSYYRINTNPDTTDFLGISLSGRFHF